MGPDKRGRSKRQNRDRLIQPWYGNSHQSGHFSLDSFRLLPALLVHVPRESMP